MVRNKNTASLMPTKININRGFVLKRQLLLIWLSYGRMSKANEADRSNEVR